MSTTLNMSEQVVMAALTYLGVELEEGADPSDVLDDILADHNLSKDDFLTKNTLFACGYHRGLTGASLDPSELVPSNGEGIDADLKDALETGFGFGLEARDLTTKAPPPSLVFQAVEDGDVSWGQVAQWASGLDLSNTHRLAVPVTVGSGKSAVVIPAGTPVDLLVDDFEKDDQPHVIVGWDGLALIVPNPEDSPRVVSGDTEVEAKSTRKSGRKKSDKKAATKKVRGPTLRSVIISVITGADGGPGPLQNNGAIAGRVLDAAREAGIGNRAANFMAKADKHVPYYLGIYGPTKDGHTGRLGVENPLQWVVTAVKARRYYLKAEGDHEARMAEVPEALRELMEDREATIATTPAPEKKKDEPEASTTEASTTEE